MVEQVRHLGVGEAWSMCRSKNLVDHVVQGCRRFAERPLLLFEDGVRVERAQFLDLCAKFAGYLRGRIKPGDHVGVAIGNRTEYFVALIAVIANRGVVVSLNPEAKQHDAGYILSNSNPVLLVVEESNRALYDQLAPTIPSIREVICVSGAEPDGLPGPAVGEPPFDLEAVACERADVTTVFYTSGTTGPPKGCMVDHDWWLRIVDVDLRMLPNGRERALCSVPFFYADPAIYLMELLQIGGTLVPMRRFSVSRYWDVVSKFDVTKIHAIASIPVLLLKTPPHPKEKAHRVHHATCVAVPPKFHRDLVERFGFRWIDNYGATESGQMCRMPWHMHDEMIGSGSLGVPDPEVDLRVVDDQGQDVPRGSQGEALVRGPGMFTGYYNRPDATAEALRDGWYHTGDLVRQDARGFVFFEGRKKDIIRRGGENVAAAEVEAVLRLIPQVKDSAVLPVPDEIRGEEIKAYVLLNDGVAEADLPPEEIVRFCAERLAPFKVPRFIEYRTGDFPRTPSTRVQKQELKAEKQDLREGAWDREAAMGRTRR